MMKKSNGQSDRKIKKLVAIQDQIDWSFSLIDLICPHPMNTLQIHRFLSSILQKSQLTTVYFARPSTVMPLLVLLSCSTNILLYLIIIWSFEVGINLSLNLLNLCWWEFYYMITSIYVHHTPYTANTCWPIKILKVLNLSGAVISINPALKMLYVM